MHGAGSVPHGRDLQPLDRRLLEPHGRERDDVQRRERLHADRHLSVGNLHRRQSGHLRCAGPVPHGRDLQPLERGMLEPTDRGRDEL